MSTVLRLSRDLWRPVRRRIHPHSGSNGRLWARRRASRRGKEATLRFESLHDPLPAPSECFMCRRIRPCAWHTETL